MSVQLGWSFLGGSIAKERYMEILTGDSEVFRGLIWDYCQALEGCSKKSGETCDRCEKWICVDHQDSHAATCKWEEA